MPQTDCSLLVMSCDAYDDLWGPYFALLDRHWPDCPFPIYLGAEEKMWCDPKICSLKSSAGGRNWSGRLIDYLKQLPHTYVLLMLDDFFLRRRVSNDSVFQCVAFAHEHHATQVRLVPRPRPTNRLLGHSHFGESAPGSRYRLSTQAAIWNRTNLLALLRPGESIWDFEHQGNSRIAVVAHGFYSVWQPMLPYEGFFAHHVVEKGKWFPHEKWIFARQGIGCDFSRRGTLPWGQMASYHLAHLVLRLLETLPWQLQVRCIRLMKLVLRYLVPRALDRLGQARP
jgi:hypothetical protein